MTTTAPTDAEIEDGTFRANIPVPPCGLVRLGELRDFLEACENLPDNALVTVQSDMIHYEESSS